ncbi:HEAT repeat domain-containing protein [Streptomyces sp. NPDC006641]|uniref:HEAT repeat domain-containing protein n=1 Tax=unclassified Streptomyces TaxID=2593676 RepID=UPI003674B772
MRGCSPWRGAGKGGGRTPGCLGGRGKPGVWDGLAPETVPALLRLARDPDARVRAAAAVAPAASRDRSPAVADALMTLLDEDDQLVRLEAAYGLSRRDDPRDRRGGTARSPSSTTTGSVGSGGGHGGRRTRRPSLIGPWGRRLPGRRLIPASAGTGRRGGWSHDHDS